MRGGTVILCALLAGLIGCGDGGGSDVELKTELGTEAAGPGTGGGSGGVRLVKVGDFEQPLYITQPQGSDDLYVVEKPGRVRIVRDGAVLPDPFIDISARVSASGEQGLLSIAFAPDFAESRLLYAYYTDLDGDQRVVEFEANADGSRVEPGSERLLLIMDDFASNHNGGLLLFGPDERLYIGTGDGGTSGDQRNGQDLGSLLAKILRIDPRASGGEPYSIPADNPFVGRQGARPEIFSYGLRNPWRFSFDAPSQSLFIGDVGQSAFEEVDHVTLARARGANFGWSAFEGNEEFNDDQSAPGHIPPALAYGRDAGCSVTGGYVVRDRALRSLYGRYLYGDYCGGELRSFIPSGGAARDDRALGLTVPALSSFGVDTDGRIYVTSLDGGVFRLAPA